MQVLDLLHGIFEVPDVQTVEGEDVMEEVKARVLKAWEIGWGWVEVGKRVSVTKKEREQGPVWLVTRSQSGRMAIELNRWKVQVEEVELLLEDIFEGGKLRMEKWLKRMGKEVWRKRGVYTIYLDADKALVWEILDCCTLRAGGGGGEAGGEN